jgi:hypothetical protein
MHELEKVYDIEILPLVQRITLIAKQTNLPIFITAQDSPDGFRTTCLNDEYSEYDRFKMHRMANQSWSIDDLLRNILEDAKFNGHNSEILKAMGIPEIPVIQEK